MEFNSRVWLWFGRDFFFFYDVRHVYTCKCYHFGRLRYTRELLVNAGIYRLYSANAENRNFIRNFIDPPIVFSNQLFTRNQIALCDEKSISTVRVPNTTTSIRRELLLDIHYRPGKDFRDAIAKKKKKKLWISGFR